MRRSFSVAFLSALLLGVPSAFAQRGGHVSGGVSGGHAGGSFGGGHISAPAGRSFGGSFSGGAFSRPSGVAPRIAPPLFTSPSAPRSFATAPQFTSTAPSRAFVPGYRIPYRGPTPARRPEQRNDGHHRPPYRGGIAYPYANSWEVLPWDLGDPEFTGYNGYGSGSDSASDAAQQPAAPSDDAYGPGNQEPAYQNYQPAYNQPTGANSIAGEPELTLIFNDGHREAIHNYVLTAQAVIVLDQAASGHQQRIPLASLDLTATQQAAQQAGLDFTPPA
jgi:hypothetical protein